MRGRGGKPCSESRRALIARGVIVEDALVPCPWLDLPTLRLRGDEAFIEEPWEPGDYGLLPTRSWYELNKWERITELARYQ